MPVLHQPSCSMEKHSVCDRCLAALPQNQRRCSCLPFEDGACLGEHATYRRERVRAPRHAVRCPHCRKTTKYLRSTLRQQDLHLTCSHCSKAHCHGCGNEPERCSCSRQAEWKNRDAYSRYFVDEEGIPLRKRDVTRAMAVERIREVLRQDSDNFPVACLRCGVLLARSSACHELSHCGAKICWVSGRTTLPWEPCLPSWHWSQVPRWQHECPVVGFQCREGHCCHEDEECTLPQHEEGRRRMTEYRKKVMVQLISREVL